MRNTIARLACASAYAIAMALLEAVVVVYLRALLQVSSDRVTLGPFIAMEVGREAATLVMLVAVGWLAGRRWNDRLAYALFAFGLWDLWYYSGQVTKLHFQECSGRRRLSRHLRLLELLGHLAH